MTIGEIVYQNDGKWREQSYQKRRNRGRIKEISTDKGIDHKKTEATAKRAFNTKYALAVDQLHQAEKEVKLLQARVEEQQSRIKELTTLKGIQRPTVHDIRLTLIKANQVIAEIIKFKDEAMALQSEVAKVNPHTAILEDLQMFSKWDTKYDSLIDTYGELLPRVTTALLKLNKAKLKATYKLIPEELHQSISAQFLIHEEKIKTNQSDFLKAFKLCEESPEEINKEFLEAKVALKAVNDQLNAIDHKIYLLKNPSAWGYLYCGEKFRLSPLDKGFSLGKPKVEEVAVAVIETPVVQTV